MQTRVLSFDGVPLRSVPVGRALRKLARGVAYVVEAHPDLAIRNASGAVAIPIPRIIAETRGGFRPARFYAAPLTNSLLFIRDGHRCAYCGRHKSELRRGERLTRDHILPRSRGGRDDWLGVTTACTSCNGRKADRTPQEAGMPTPTGLYAPTRLQIASLARNSSTAA